MLREHVARKMSLFGLGYVTLSGIFFFGEEGFNAETIFMCDLVEKGRNKTFKAKRLGCGKFCLMVAN